jgi:acyl carrier protein
MLQQIEIDFVSRKQNSKENQEILEDAKPRLNKQCYQVKEMLELGMKLTVREAAAGIWLHGEKVFIGDLRARVRDLLANGYPVQKEKLKGGFKKYYLKTKEEIMKEKTELFEKLKQVILDKTCTEDEITLASTLEDDLGLDSLDKVELLMECEVQFKINIEDEEYEKIETVDDLLNTIHRKLP